MACSGVFGTPGWVRTSGLSLRRRPLYPTELRGLIQKIFDFRVQPDSNELPLRRRVLYPAELLRQILLMGLTLIRENLLHASITRNTYTMYSSIYSVTIIANFT